MSLTHIVIIAIFFFIGGLGMTAIQAAFAAFYTHVQRAGAAQHNAVNGHGFSVMTKRLVWK